MTESRGVLRRYKDQILSLENLVDTSAMLLPVTPILAMWEQWALGMSDLESLQARATAAVISSLGTNKIYVALKKRMYERYNLDFAGEVKRRSYEALFTGIYATAYSAVLYATTAHSWGHFLTGIVVTGFVMGNAMGPPMNISMEAMQEATHTKKTTGMLQRIREWSKPARVALAGTMITASVAATTMWYRSTPDDYRGNEEVQYQLKDRWEPAAPLPLAQP